ncbi:MULTISPECIES: phage Gp37/Gp68 family protein [unclassified Rhizobium]|uniref:phage Gp37/Gp68 family protein n=1 Tax=unclassified Rhizobium TaxID=2613769 RepID=UPI001ADBCE07|nr:MULTISPECIES: phage Gp37/Gp68 family protein [unclassified Rhizobium]MBO9125492.1 phage Gp37/Gp68 family protein [Rhizobium sp. 16-488-2b]MBO9176077.1 phage Gp37/Gp68 family protein [Rhizobium sp. 16-488-2a]
MAENSAISWTTHTWNPWMGCTKISPACDGCYAEALMDKRYNRVQWGPHGDRVRTGTSTWREPLRWQKRAEKDGDRPFVFCASLADIFDNQVDPHWRADAFDVMRRTPNLVYLLLTKRPQNIVKLSDAVGGLPANVALGTTVEDQKRADQNLPALQVAKIETNPLFTFGSFEPLLGMITIPQVLMPDWIITGGETDQGKHRARPSHPDWFRSLRDQAATHGAAYHHKQNGEWSPLETRVGTHQQFAIDHDGNLYASHEISYPDGVRRGEINERARASLTAIYKVGKKQSGRMLDGVTHDEFPELRTS